MQIHVNGERRELKDESQLSDLLQELSLAPERVAVELNHEVVRRNDWPNTILKEGDRVEIVHFVGGGEQEAESRRQEAEGSNWVVITAFCFLPSAFCLLFSPTYEMNDLNAIAFFQNGIRPIISAHDFMIEFHGDPLRCEREFLQQIAQLRLVL